MIACCLPVSVALPSLSARVCSSRGRREGCLLLPQHMPDGLLRVWVGLAVLPAKAVGMPWRACSCGAQVRFVDGVVAELRGVSEGGLLLPQHEHDHLFREEYSCPYYPGRRPPLPCWLPCWWGISKRVMSRACAYLAAIGDLVCGCPWRCPLITSLTCTATSTCLRYLHVLLQVIWQCAPSTPAAQRACKCWHANFSRRMTICTPAARRPAGEVQVVFGAAQRARARAGGRRGGARAARHGAQRGGGRARRGVASACHGCGAPTQKSGMPLGAVVWWCAVSLGLLHGTIPLTTSC